MKQPCEGCHDKLVFVASEKSKGYGTSKGVNSHTLCQRAQVACARMGPKPNWAVRATLRVLEEQAVGKDTGC